MSLEEICSHGEVPDHRSNSVRESNSVHTTQCSTSFFPLARRAGTLHSTEHWYGDVRLAPDIICRITTSSVQCCTQSVSHHWSTCTLSSFIARFLTPALIPLHGTDPYGLDVVKSWCKACFRASVPLLHVTFWWQISGIQQHLQGHVYRRGMSLLNPEVMDISNCVAVLKHFSPLPTQPKLYQTVFSLLRKSHHFRIKPF